MKILVIGATGTVGAALVSALAQRGLSAVAATRNPAAHSFPRNITAALFDYAKPDTVRAALSGVDRMFVLAPPGMPDQAEHWKKLFAEARAAGVQHVVLMTAKGAAEDTPHGQGESALKTSGLAWTLLHPTFFAQNFATYARESICHDSAFYYPAGEGRTAFVDVRDIAEVAATVLASPSAHAGKRYELTGPAALSMHEVAVILSNTLGRSIRYVEPDETSYRNTLIAMGLPTELAGMFTHLYAVVVKNGWAAGTSGDISTVLGRAPLSFETFATDHAALWAPTQSTS